MDAIPRTPISFYVVAFFSFFANYLFFPYRGIFPILEALFRMQDSLQQWRITLVLQTQGVRPKKERKKKQEQNRTRKNREKRKEKKKVENLTITQQKKKERAYLTVRQRTSDSSPI